MFGVVAGFITALALSPATPEVASCPSAMPGLGAANAPTVVTYFLDPLLGSHLANWLDLRSQIAALRGEVRAEVAIVESSKVASHGRIAVLLWMLRVQERGRLESGLRLLEREGLERLLARLNSAEARRLLAKELGLKADDFEGLRSDPCLTKRLTDNTAKFHRQGRRASGAQVRPPAFVVGDQPAFEKVSYLSAALDKQRRLLRDPVLLTASPSRRRRGVSPRVRRPPANAGLLIGDIGSPHRLVVFLRPDPRPRLTQLAPVLRYQRNHPGKLALQLIVRGTSPESQDLRRRMCHATSLGLEVEYVHMLAAGRTQWSTHARDPDVIEAILDAHEPEKPCSLDEAQLDGEGNLPDGVWLDGGIIGQTTDLEHIASKIAEIERSTNPADAVFSLLPQSEI